VTERAVFDLRCWVEADTADEVFRQIAELLDRARADAPAGVDVRYWQLRNGHPLSAFRPTIERPKRKRAA
jgi:hypothetical protein